MVAGINPVETLATLIQFRDQQQIGDWVVFADAPNEMIRDYRVTIRSTKVSILPDGEIVERKPFSSNPAAYWQNVLDDLLAGA